MNKCNRGYKFRLYPNKHQRELINKTIGCARFIYNQMLTDKINHYKETKEMLNNTPAQYKIKYEWLKEVDSRALANAQMNLNKAYKNFFRDKRVGFPKFKSKKKSKQSYTTNNQNGMIIIIDNKYIKLPKIKEIRCKIHRQIPNTYIIKSATISKTPSGKYYVSILVEYKKEKTIVNLDKNKALGLDYSSSSFYVDSQDIKADYPKFYRNAQIKLTKEQRKLSNMEFKSSNYLKQKIKVAKIHEHITNQRLDWIHNLTKMLSEEWDYICIEDINLQNISQSFKLGKSTHDNGFGMFRVILQYKMDCLGKQLVKIDKWFPSSKMCHECSNINYELQLSDRVWICKSCGSVVERDYNSALNIRDEGLRMIV